MTSRSMRPRALVLPELLAAAALAVILVALLFVAAQEARRHSSLGKNFSNLKQFASGTAGFAADNDDRVWSLRGPTFTDGANHAWSIMVQRSGLTEWLGPFPPGNWIPHILYSHLVVLDYLDMHAPDEFAVGPEDHLRLRWMSDPVGFMALPLHLRPGGHATEDRRFPFSSSYELAPAFYARDARRPSPAASTLHQAPNVNYNQFDVGQLPLGGRRLSEVAHPAQKVMVFEQQQRHFGPRRLIFAYPEARIPVMLADGSVAVKRTGDANRGFRPNAPLNAAATQVWYQPSVWELSPPANGQEAEFVTCYYRWTRSGLRGRDFGGPEVPWVD